MRIKVLFFSSLKEKLGKTSEEFKFTGNLSITELKNFLISKYPEGKDILNNSMFAVNEQYVDEKYLLKNGDTIAIIPPVSGG